MLLLDTCTLLWLSTDPPSLPAAVQERIRSVAAGRRFVSAISAFEIGLKHAQGKLQLRLKARAWLDRSCAVRGILVLPISKDIALRATELPWHHRDPADRLILATAIEHGLTILSPDPAFAAYKGVKLSW